MFYSPYQLEQRAIAHPKEIRAEMRKIRLIEECLSSKKKDFQLFGFIKKFFVHEPSLKDTRVRPV